MVVVSPLPKVNVHHPWPMAPLMQGSCCAARALMTDARTLNVKASDVRATELKHDDLRSAQRTFTIPGPPGPFILAITDPPPLRNAPRDRTLGIELAARAGGVMVRDGCRAGWLS